MEGAHSRPVQILQLCKKKIPKKLPDDCVFILFISIPCSLVESIPRVNVISVETIEACNHEVSMMGFFCLE